MRCTIIKIIFFVLFACLANGVFGQINGVIRDEQGVALEGVHVWLSGTQSGDLSDTEGAFLLPINHGGPIEIVASHIGFNVYKQVLTLRDTSRSLSIRMRRNLVELDEVMITAQASKKRKKWLKQFEQAFFGSTENAKYCEILNPEILLFKQSQGRMSVQATDLIQLRNSALGYNVTLQLDHARIQVDGISYSGKFLFESIVSTDIKVQSQHERARRKAYLGSLNHFFRALINNSLRTEDFRISEVQVVGGQVSEETARTRDQILRKGQKEGEYILLFNHVLKVVYDGEEDHVVEGLDKIGTVGRTLGRPAEQDMISQEKNVLRKSQSAQISYLFLKKVPLTLLEGGYLKNPRHLEEQGYLSNERFAEMLPFEFSVAFDERNDRKNRHKTDGPVDVDVISAAEGAVTSDDRLDSDYTVKNGFSLTNLKIPEDEIQSGGPPRDGLRAIDHPLFVRAAEISDIDDDEVVLGIVINNEARAYPTRILDRHEIVNDMIHQIPVAISYCPLCNSGIGFERNVDGVVRTFGVSGLLYNSDVLMFDRESESLWSQIMGSAISGMDAGTSLNILPVVMCSWGWWKEQYPESDVLIGGEGLSANYSKTAYTQYRSSQSLMFPVAEQSKALRNKDMVIGMMVRGEAKAYPYKVIAKSEKPILDELNGQALIVYYDKKQNTAWITDEANNLLAAEPMYWFAWYAFHPETKVYR